MSIETVQASVVAPIQRTTKLLGIGRMWDNSATAQGNQPKFRILLDRNLGLHITLVPMSELVLFENKKREGKRDADYRVAISLPTAVVDTEVARQRGSRGVAVAAAAA